MQRSQLQRKSLVELREIAGQIGLKSYQRLKKADLVSLIIGEAEDPPAAEQPTLDDDGEGDADDTSEAEAPVQTRPASRRAASDDTEGRPRTRNRSRTDDDGQNRGGARDNGGGSSNGSGSGGANGGDKDRSGDDGDTDRRPRTRRTRSREDSSQQDNASGNSGYDDQEVREGVLDLLPEGYGFLRVTSYLSGERDVYVSQQYVRRFDLRRGDRVAGPIRRNKGKNDKFPALARVETVEGEQVREGAARRPLFTDLVPVHPNDGFPLDEAASDSPTGMAVRVMDHVAPIGRGQRVLVTAPPQAGRTSLLRELANELLDEDTHVMVVLVDERPEEVTDFEQGTEAEVIAASFDRTAEEQTQLAELAVERAKRMVERGQDVVVLLDSLSRLVRAYDVSATSTVRNPLGSVEAASVYPVKQLFGAARQVDDGGSLTIIATALVGTGTTDELVRAEMATIATCEVTLRRTHDDDRLWPSVDVTRTATRHVDQLLDPDDVTALEQLRASFPADDQAAALDLVVAALDA